MVTLIEEIEKKVKGKKKEIKLILAAFFAKGHVLLEDIPGVGKTTMAKTISKVLGLEFKRVQFTSDLLPSDILGVNYFDLDKKEFIFKRGPIFTEILLADEINRASPKTQSALLEAMEERQVSIDKTYKLYENFFVIATQNPKEEFGVFPLPISQLDRFMISLSLGYPAMEFEKEILLNKEVEIEAKKINMEAINQLFNKIYVDEKIVDLILKIGEFSRNGLFEYGLSTRGLFALLNISKSWAMIHGREYVIDDDIAKVLPYVIRHRIKPKSKMDINEEFLKLF